jgi:two-component system OmpR family response regulator
VRHCILLVDDDASVRRSLTRLLRAHDYEVLEAENATAALQLLETTRPALMLMDMVMPGEDALATARSLKAERATPPPIIALTASPPLAPSDRALFADVLPKPCDPRALLTAIERALNDGGGPAR